MGIIFKKAIMLSAILALFWISGCASSTFFIPKADAEIVSIDPYQMVVSDALPTTLPEVTVNILPLNNINFSLISYDMRYYTRIEEEIKSLAYINKPMTYKFPISEGEPSETSISFTPFTPDLYELFQTTQSQISPVRAEITMYFEDINNHKFSKTFSLLLYKPGLY